MNALRGHAAAVRSVAPDADRRPGISRVRRFSRVRRQYHALLGRAAALTITSACVDAMQFSAGGIHHPLVRGDEPVAQPRADLEHGADDGRAGRSAHRRQPAPRRLDVGLDSVLHERAEEGAQADQRRSETIAKSGMFKAAFAARRCLDPDGKTPFAVARIDGEPVAFGGIWERWQSPEGEILQTFATITTDANRQLASIQDRMPVIIERQDWALWLGEAHGDPGSLLRPAPEDVLRVWPVGKAVGNFRNDGPELLEPSTVTEPTLL